MDAENLAAQVTEDGISILRMTKSGEKTGQDDTIAGFLRFLSLTDAAGKSDIGAISYTLSADPEIRGRYEITLEMDPAFYADPDISYPVCLSSVCTWTDKNTTDFSDISISSGKEGKTGRANTLSSYISVGQKDGENWQSYVQYPVFRDQLKESDITRVSLNLMETEQSQADGTIQAFPITEEWSMDEISWNQVPAVAEENCGSAVTVGTEGNVVSLNLTEYFLSMLNDTGGYYGVALKTTEPGVFIQFYGTDDTENSTSVPTLSVIYAAEQTETESEMEEPEEDLSQSEEEISFGQDMEAIPHDDDADHDNSGIAGEAGLVGELTDLRGERHKQFLMDDGTISVVQYDTDVHYLDEAENWQQIDNRLNSADAEDHSDVSGYSNNEGRVKFKFAKNVNANFLVRIMQGPYHLYFSAEDTQKQAEDARILTENEIQTKEDDSLAKQVEVENIRSAVVYENIFPGTDLEYVTSGSNLKENIIVKEKKDTYQYTFEIKTNKLDIQRQADGSISFLTQDTGELLYTIPVMYMWDADGAESEAVEFQISTQNKKSTLTITADEEWLNADDRVFPVTIDPTLEASSTSTGDEARIVRNQYVASGKPAMSSAGYGRGYLGYDGSGDKIYRMFVQFKTLPQIPKSSVIAGAKFYYAQALYDHVGMSELIIAAKEVTEDWNWGTKVTWNSQPSFSSTILDYQILSAGTTGKYVGWDITKLIKTHYENKDNAGTETSSFVLVGTEEGNYAYNHLAKADVIQENSAGYFSSAQPVLVITYRDTQGLEDYYTYQTQSVGKAGIGYIGDYTKQLTLERTNFATNSTAIPFQISNIYNSSFGDQYFSSSSNNTKNFNNMKIGMGWKLNIQETIIEKTISGKKYLVYNDSDGTDHYMPLDSGSTYKDEDGLKLTVTKATSPVKYTMTDEKGNQKIFYNGFLSSILDANGNAIHLLYNGAEYSAGGTWYADTGSTNRITKVVQVNKGQSTPKTVATLDYADTTFLHSITDSAGRTWQYKFTRGADADGNPSGYNLTKIIDPDGTYARYDYYLISTHKVNKLSRTYDSETLLGGRYTYSVTKQSCRMNSFGEIHWTSDTEYQKDQTVAITNTDPLQVYYQDYGLDCKSGTAGDIWTYVTFDNAGRTISEASMDASRQVYYGASSTAYTGTGSTASAHKVLNDVVTGVNGINLLKNGSAETISGSKATGWEAHRNVSSGTVDKMAMSYDTSGAIRTGSRSFHVTTETGAQPNSSGLLRATFSATAALTAGKTYTFSGYFSNTDAANFNDRSHAYLKINNSSGTQMAVGSVVDECTSVGIEDGWARLSVTFTPSASGTYTFAACTDWIYGSSSFDDFQLEEGEAASRYNYLTNGDLEWADGWSYSGASREQGSIHGSYNIKIPGDPLKKNTASITVPLKVSSNNNFVLSGWAKANSAADIDKEKSSERAFGLEAVLTYSDSTTETHYVSFDGSTSHLQFASGNIVPKKADQTLSSIQIRCVYGKNVNTAYFDNICLRKEPVECYKYDSEGNVTAVNTTGNDQLTFAYSAGNLIKEQSKGEGTYNYTYDSKHNLTRATNDGVDMVLTYDAMGHVKTSKVQNTASDSNKSISTTATYTGDGDYMATQTDATGAKTTYTTNSYGLTESVTDALSHKTVYGYNTKNNRMTSVTLDDGTAVKYTYTNSMVSSIVRDSLLPDGSTKISQSYTYAYDLYDNVTAVKVGSKTLVSYTYMAKNGPLTKVTYGNGNTVEYTHDALGRVITEKQNGTLKYRYIYGSEGDLSRLEEVDNSGKVVKATCYEYDSLDRLIRSWDEVLEGNVLVKDVSTQHLYDTSNRLKQQSWQTSDGTSRSETYTYNSKDGTLTRMKTASGRTITLSYDYLKRLQSKTDGVRTAAYTYKDVGTSGTSTQVTGLAWTGLGDNNLAFGYTYDKLGNITKVTSNSATSAQYTYDAQSQLVTEKLPQSSLEYTYSYDTGGNIRSIVTKNNGVQTTRTFSYTDGNWKDLLTAVDGHCLTYDAGGNPLTYYNGTDWTFTWKNGRELATAVSGNTTVSNTYDSDGMRTSRTVNGVTHNYVYLGGLLVEETWGNNRLQFAYDEQNRPYSVKYNDNLYYYVLNIQGDVVRLVNGDGVIRAEYTYNAWGELIGITNGGAIATVNPLRYRGYVYDSETGFYYVSSRYYDPEVGRFLNADDPEILFEDQDNILENNLYTYCFNNPVNYEDSSGYAATMALRMGTRIALKGLGRSALPSLAGSITPAGWVVIGVVIVCGIVYAKTKKEKRKEEVDPYARPGQKKQGREVKSKSRRNKNFKSNNNKRNNKPAKPKSHTPMRDHQKYKQ